ncbi:MAG: DUF4340 domain-containing protein [Polyangiaceae bacterium]|nr:DUF4340 domain-containing protein [Polyangiaceae bacterium]
MKLLRSLATHSAVLVAATVFALSVWNREDAKRPDSEATVQVWPGPAEAVERITYDSEKTKVRIDRRKDDAGRYYLVEVNKQESTPAKAPESDPDDPDAGAAAAGGRSEHKVVRLVAVDSANDLVDLLAPLKALRAIGRVGPGRAAEFGFDKPEGRLSVNVGGASRELVVGGVTPGGADRYVKVTGSGEVYAVSGQIVRMLAFAESRLVERELHKFEPGQLKRVRITSPAGTREFVDLGGEGWARANSPKAKDETAGNWMTKLNGLSVTEYVEKLPAGAAPVLHVDFMGSSGRIGYLDLSKVTEANAKAPRYFARSERTRWYGQVLQSAADQLEQDLPTLMR